jgi:hypothetical protein
MIDYVPGASYRALPGPAGGSGDRFGHRLELRADVTPLFEPPWARADSEAAFFGAARQTTFVRLSDQFV